MVNLEQKLTELMILTAEECGELTQACMKIIRHGLEPHRVAALIEEVGDVQCLIDLMQVHDVMTFEEVDERIAVKKAKLEQWSSLYD
jgi:NTP pyrophosphatase (non-canonical NTP hydrolase)|tara:strand:- start:2740 stop:3000 length:261 start_codon:yes stop_codon:yes gene_type:complete